MRLLIRDSSKLVDKEFGNWLQLRIRAKLIVNAFNYKLQLWDKYLTESDSVKRLYNRDYKALDVILFAANNLVCKGIDGEVSIQFNDTKFVPGFDRLTLGVIVKTINYGTLDVKACSIFTDTFNYFAKDIDTFVKEYYKI